MLTKLFLEHFKCFEKLNLPLAPLTLLSGLNASGKSTILQALSLLHQTMLENEWNHNLILNGTLTTLGTASDVIDKITGRNQFKIGVSTKTCEYIWVMEAEQRKDALAVPVRSIEWREAPEWQQHTKSIKDSSVLRRLVPMSKEKSSENTQNLSDILFNLSYISADRIGPRETYVATTPDQQTGVGTRGEFTPWFLHHYADKRPLNGLLLEDSPPTIKRQTEAWVRQFFPGASLDVTSIDGTNLIIMGIRTSDATNYHRPQNVGYGITHVLPILAACIGSDSGSLVLIENPESHLHPAGQAAMGVFLAKVADSGTQVILETHSDHVLNGVRRAVKEHRIEADSVGIHFFMPRSADGSHSQIISPIIDRAGAIDHWPDGFFDQYDKDTASLIDW